jgi:hypothetical protein
MGSPQITINRAPVLMLWAAVVAERLGYDRDAAVTLGKAVAGLNAQSKARRLGIIEASTDHDRKRDQRARKPAKLSVVPLLGRQVAAITTARSLRATRRQVHTILTATADRNLLAVGHAPVHRHLREGGGPDEETTAEEKTPA